MQNSIKNNIRGNILKIFQLIKRKNPKLFLIKWKLELCVPLFIPLKIKKNIQQVGLEYVIVSQIVDIKIKLVVLEKWVVQSKSQQIYNWRNIQLNNNKTNLITVNVMTKN